MASPYDALLDEPKAAPSPYDALLSTDKPAASPYDALLAPVAPKPTAQELAQKDHGEIFAHAAQNPDDFDLAYEADKLRRARPMTAKVGEAITSAPAAVWHGVKGVGNFLTGIPQVALHTAEQAKAEFPIATQIATAGTSALVPDRAPETLQAENTLAAQHGEQSLSNLERGLRAALDSPTAPNYMNLGGAGTKATTQQPTKTEIEAFNEDKARKLFAQRVQAAKNELQLARGEPLDTGAIAGIYHLAGQQPSEEVGPEALKQAGVEQADPDIVGRMAAASDPMMLALASAPGLPGAAKIGGGATELAGKALSGAGKAISATTKAVNPLKLVRRALNPTSIATDAAKEGGARGLQAIGDVLAQQGRELRTGTPSPLTTAAATAAATGERALGTNLKRAAGDAAAKGAATAVGMAPINAVMAEGDPKALSESTVGAGVFGGALGSFQRNRPLMVEAVRPHLRSEGARALWEAGGPEGNDPLAAKSAAYVMSLPEAARDSTLEAIGALQGLPATTGTTPQRAKLYVLNEADYQRAIEDNFGKEQAAQGGGRGFFLTNDGKAFINGDYHAGLEPGELQHSIGHEFGGHAAMNVMRAMGSKGGMLYQKLMDAAKQALFVRQPSGRYPDGTPTPDFKRFVDEYNRRFDPTGKTQRLDWRNPEALEEWLSEQSGQLLAAKGAGELALPQTVQDRINDGVGRFLGAMLGVDMRKVGTGTHFSREEVGKLSKMVQDTLSQVVGMKMREGAEIPEPAKTDTTRIAELQSIIDTPRPAQGIPVETVQEWIRARRSAQSELSTLREGTEAATPATGPAPKAPSKPIVTNPPDVTSDALKMLGVMGIKGPRAQSLIRQANEQHGAPIMSAQNLANGAFKIHGGKAVQPGEYVPKPAAPPEPVSIPTGDKAVFKDELGATHTVTGPSSGAPRIGDIVATREGEIRRITRIMGDTVDTARPIDPLNARGTKTHKLGDIQALDHDYAATPEVTPNVAPEVSTPTLRVEPRGDRFIVVDAAGNPVSGNTFATKAAANQSIRQKGKGKFSIIPNPTDAPDIIDTIQDRLPGIYFDGMSKEEAASFIGDKYLRDLLATDNPDYAPDEVLRNVQPTPEEQIDHRVDSIAELGQRIEEAYRQRKSLAAQQEAEAKRLNAEEKAAKKGAVKMVAAAYKTKDGEVVTGIDHMDADMKAAEMGKQVDHEQPGFVDANGKFYTREEAYKAATGQVDPSLDTFDEGKLHTGKLNESFDEPTPDTAPPDNIPTEPAVATAVSERPPDAEEPATLSPAALDEIAAQAEQTVVAGRAGTKKKASTLPKEVSDAQVDAVAAAHEQSVPANYQGVKLRTDALGKKTISGTFNLARPFDAFLLKLADLSEKHLGILQDLQSKLGQTVTINYGHAPEESGKVTAGARKAAQAASTAQARASGEAATQAQDKNMSPLEIRFNKGKAAPSITILGASPEKLLSNFNHVVEVLNEFGEKVPYRDIHDPHLVADMKGVARNHANGWKGDGGARVESFPDVAVPTPDEGYKPYQIPQDRFQFLNLILGDESAKTGVKGATPEQKVKQGLAAKNRIPMSEEGETNMLRHSINMAKGPVVDASGKETTWSKATIENPLSEALRVDLVNEVHPEVKNEDGSIRPSGYKGDIGRFFAEGSPSRTFSAAGFLPDTGAPKTAKEKARERIAGRAAFMPSDSTTPEGESKPEGREPSAPPQDRLSTEGTSGNNTEDTGRRNENLMEEAERAGIQPSLEVIKGVLRNDKAAMDKLRAMIRDKTGKDAKWMPTETMRDDMTDQAGWLEQEALSRGYKSTDELVAEEPGEFRKLSARWRLLHPRDEKGFLSQNEASRRINNTLYGDKNSDTSRPLAGTREAFRDAAAHVGGSERTGRSPEEQAAALREFAQEKGIAFQRLPRGFEIGSSNDKGGMEHHVWFDPKSSRWIKATNGSGQSMGLRPVVTKDGGWGFERGTVKDYLESRALWNRSFGDDIRLHGVWDDGKNVSVVTSQPDISGEPMTRHEIMKAMESAGFSAMGDSVFYRKRDNIAVFDMHEGNAVNHDGVMIPFDGIILHPSEELVDILKFDKATGKTNIPTEDSSKRVDSSPATKDDRKHRDAKQAARERLAATK